MAPHETPHVARVLVPIAEQARRAQSAEIDAAVTANLSRLFVFDAEMPVRFDLSQSNPPAEPRFKLMPKKGPVFFYSGNSRNTSRTVYKPKTYSKFSRT